MPLAAEIPPAWRAPLTAVVEAPAFAALAERLDAEYARASVFPPREQIFAALERTPPAAVRVVLLGQDPYPTRGNAHGLAFSVARGTRPPASLRNLLRGLAVDLGVPTPAHGDLGAWADRGVLLLNATLTVREGEPQSHRRLGWAPLATAVLRHVDALPHPVVFLCLGKPALAAVRAIAPRKPVVHAPHPSPLNGSAFVDTVARERTFRRVHELLGEPLDWSLPA